MHQAQHRRCDLCAAGGDAIGGHHDFSATAHGGRQRGQAWLAEQHAHIGAQAHLAHAFDQADRQQRMPAQFEEMIMAPHAFKLEHVLPDLRQQAFHLALGGFVATADQGGLVGCRQRLAVQLAVVSQRQAGQRHIGRRQHVVRQLALQLRVYLVNAQVCASPGEIGHQALVPRHVFTGEHGNLLDTRTTGQACLDLAQFDTETADFDLVVIAPQALQQALLRPAPEVASAIHQCPRLIDKGVAHELLGGQLRTVQVALGDALPANADFTGDAQRHRLQLRIQHIDLRVGNGPAHRHAVCIQGQRTHFIGGGVGGGFGRAVAMHQTQRRGLRQQAAKGGRVGTFAAAQQNAQAGQGLGNQLHILVEQRGGDEQHRSAFEFSAKRQRVEQGGVVDHLDLAAVEQRAPHIHGAGVERRVGRKRDAVMGVEVGIAVIDHQPADAAMGHQHAFGRTGGAGGVHDVRHAVRALGHSGVGRRHYVQVQLGEVVQHLAGAAVLHHEGLAFRRRIDVQRHVDRRAFEYSQLADDQVDGTRQRQGDRLTRLHALVK